MFTNIWAAQQQEFFGEQRDSSCSTKTCYHAAVTTSSAQ